MIAANTDNLKQVDLTPSAGVSRTVWGLDPLNLHFRFWAAYGVQVVRQGEPSQIVRDAELYLLTDPRTLTLFKLFRAVDVLNWSKPQVVFLRMHDQRDKGYRERAVTDAQGRFLQFERLYDASEDSRLARVALTPSREIAQLWQSAPDVRTGWRRLRRLAARGDRQTLSIAGNVYDRTVEREMASFVTDLVGTWKRPDSTVERASKAEADVWTDPAARIEGGARFIGPVWVGAGRTVAAGTTVIGPAVVWDDPAQRPATGAIQWLTIEPTHLPEQPRTPDQTALSRAGKRLFDIVFSVAALLVTLPMYPLIMLAIMLEDGRPFFFTHQRETLRGRLFPCIKFRSMRKDAESLKEELKRLNQADGPQFFMENDPRLTYVGRILRKYNLDELPQFLNVLTGDMSVVGPRPSPFSENQYCPPWREARLSVRPGITGLWQISRTRRSGSDFQEWIKYDLQYVEQRSWSLDLWIIWKTASTVLRKLTRS